jgi:hypothetical protein
MNKVMDVWAKIGSLVIVLGIIFILLYNQNGLFSQFFSVNAPVMTFLAIIMLISISIFYIPLFYFAWSISKKSKGMKIWAKIITVVIPLIVIYDILTNNYENVTYYLLLVITLVPLYYYGWKD